MPLIEVTLVEGRTPKQLRSLIHELHGAAVRAIAAPPESVRVVIREVPPTHWAAGDVTIVERRAGTGAAAATGPAEVSRRTPDETERCN
ncbi:tautomerase family protein [Streptomyces cellulosae]|uniref:tautomerase family protein n=1 Tax=Streptomyces cellulosae TaxID=1968 RepID=UPI00068E1F05|nr:4-oxalocrotonate tautomerase family protein [Streptomyces cellulosae]